MSKKMIGLFVAILLVLTVVIGYQVVNNNNQKTETKTETSKEVGGKKIEKSSNGVSIEVKS